MFLSRSSPQPTAGLLELLTVALVRLNCVRPSTCCPCVLLLMTLNCHRRRH